MTDQRPILLWFRRDLRLDDHPALAAACATGAPVIPVYIKDTSVDQLGAAPKWRLGAGLDHFCASLKGRGSQLVLRSGAACDVLQTLIKETGASAVYWQRLYDPQSVERDTDVKAALKSQGIDARSFGGHVMFEPWTVATKMGGMYRVFTPFWRNVKDRGVDTPIPAPTTLPAPQVWPISQNLSDWDLGTAMRRGGAVVARYARIGEDAALERLAQFMESGIAGYATDREFPSVLGTSGLSENLALGEVSPHQCWHAAIRAQTEGKPGAEVFLKELVWREFAYHLMHHTPHILSHNWKPEWDGFPWNTDANRPDVAAWKQGRTGIAFVDAAMRELYTTGKMHNRGRMIVASYLTKHLLTHWRVGQAWFRETLIDWDPASNAMGWQWAAGSGPDASPFFRIFNPDTQLKKFDPAGRYARAWIAEGQQKPSRTALDFYQAIPPSWGLSPNDLHRGPSQSLADGRARALMAYANRGF